MSYTTSPVHNSDTWVDLAKRLEDQGCHSLCIKDMLGLLKPYEAEELITRIKASCDVPLALHSHATTGLSTATAVKAVEAAPTLEMADPATAVPQPAAGDIESYSLKVDGQMYDVEVGPQSELTSVSPSANPEQTAQLRSSWQVSCLLIY